MLEFPSLLFLTFLFALVAFVYSMVGFGGGSSYLALLVLFNTPLIHVPIIALVCNILVVTLGGFHFIRGKHFRLGLTLPFVFFSIPFAYWGGKMPISSQLFQLILGVLLLLAAMRMLFFHAKMKVYTLNKVNPLLAVLVGSLLGFLSGLIGIGGGIFLAPILYTLRWGRPKEIAATAAVFIFFNSIFGVAGQLSKVENLGFLIHYWPLFIAVLVLGHIGSHRGSFKFQSRKIEIVTALLMLFVSIRLFINLV